jgi:hypothetical protein
MMRAIAQWTTAAALAWVLAGCKTPQAPEERLSISVAPKSATLSIGATLQLSALVHDHQGQPVSGRAVVWSSNVSAIASVDPGGLVRALAAGTSMVIAISEGMADTALMTVTPFIGHDSVSTDTLILVPNVRAASGRAGDRVVGKATRSGSGQLALPEVVWTRN